MKSSAQSVPMTAPLRRIGSIRDLAAELVLAAQNAAEDSLIGEDRFVITPNQGQPFDRDDQIRSDRDRGQKAVEIGNIMLSGGDCLKERNASSPSSATPSTGTSRSIIIISAC